jgi:hypothetical protein
MSRKQSADSHSHLFEHYQRRPVGIRTPEAIDRLIELYTATNKPEEAKYTPATPPVASMPREKK